MDNIERAAAPFKFVVTPKLRTACSGCLGYVTTCRYCSRKVEFRDSNVLITTPGPYTVVDMGDTNNGSPYQTWTNSKAATRQRCCAE